MADIKQVMESLPVFGYFFSKYIALKEVAKDIIRKTTNPWKRDR